VSFHTYEYAIFLSLITLLFWLLAKQHAARTIVLICASFFFYSRFSYGEHGTSESGGYSNNIMFAVMESYVGRAVTDVLRHYLGWFYLLLIIASAVVDFFLARAMVFLDDDPRSATDPKWSQKRRRTLLWVSVFYNLGVLCFFKYTNFAIDNVRALLGQSMLLPLVPIVLPIGISFFTFETMSYTIDVYRREIKPSFGRTAFLEYLAFISFFPHLIIGPIIRPKDMLPQLRATPVFDAGKFSEGLFLIATGAFKKLVIADNLGANLVGRVFDAPAHFSRIESLFAVYGFAMQLYCDFSGYTDIAIGSSYLLGIDLPKNFQMPYRARDLQDFWHRWHMSLSSWLRDYLYIPLGGSKKGNARTYFNLFATMVLGGFWHGAAWTYIIWGALHGSLLAVTRVWQRSVGKREPSVFARGLTVFLTFQFVCFAWIFFRAKTVNLALAMVSQIATGNNSMTNLARFSLALLGVSVLAHALSADHYVAIRRAFARLPGWAQGVLLFAIALGIKHGASNAVVPFIYNQF
jgi:D-alanyl-lipoteichoic acid acyltransferase DltB (MBOAT superfamily)